MITRPLNLNDLDKAQKIIKSVGKKPTSILEIKKRIQRKMDRRVNLLNQPKQETITLQLTPRGDILLKGYNKKMQPLLRVIKGNKFNFLS